MRYRPSWFFSSRSTGRRPVVFGGPPNTSFPASRRKVHASRVHSPEFLVALALVFICTCDAQESVRSTSNDEAAMIAEPIIVSATRTEIPLDQSPASVSVIESDEMERKQIERVADALREVPGLSVVQTGTAGQLTSVFTRGLRSEHTPV